jgi:hypothetical protein
VPFTRFYVLLSEQNFSLFTQSVSGSQARYGHGSVERDTAETYIVTTEMSVPAWKRLGLKVKAVVNNDPLALVAPRVGDAEVDEQQQKSKTKVKTKATTETKKRKVDGEDDDDDAKKSAVISKKPPKRVKLPKGEKKKLLGEHYAIRDQLQYLRTFAQDRENWKFSKQKQNWVIKNIRQVPEEYEEDLIVYLKSVQGGSKERIVADMAAVVAEWNKMVADAEAQMEADLSRTEAEAETAGGKTDKDSNNAKDKDSKKKKKQKPQPVKKEQQHSPPDYDYAVRARTVHAALTDEKLRLASIDDEVDDEVKQNEPQERESTTVLKEEDAPTPVALENVVLTETTVDVNKEEESDSSSDIDSDSDSSSDSDSDSDSDDE